MKPEMTLVVERMFPEAQMPEKAHMFDSGFDVFNHRFIKLFPKIDANFISNANKFRDMVESVDNELGCYNLTTKATQINLQPLDRVMIGTGLKVHVEYKNTTMSEFCHRHDLTWEIQVRPRSGTALKRGLTLTNCVGTLDANYSGELCLIVSNISNNNQTILLGERLAQIVPCMVALPSIIEGAVVSVDERKDNGFNSTGTN